MLGNCNIPSISILDNRFLNTYFLDILFSRAHILRTLFIFRLAKVLVWMVHNRKFQRQGCLTFGSYIRLFTVLVTN